VKKQGNILIEVMASVMILGLTTTFIVSTSIQNKSILKKRIMQEEITRDVCNLMNEFKYNISRDEIDRMLSDEKISFKYDKDFSKKLTVENITDFENGDDIEVRKIGNDDMGLKLKIIANINIDKNEISIEKEFTKSWWMDEV
jgi:CRISPR/Cas system-associated protein Cas5 (RAMP superfamily)